MQEGLHSLFQMAKTSSAIARLNDEKIPYISVLTDPTTGGVSASLAMLGDINIAEPEASGSAILISPSIARLADTPPVVGSVNTEI